MTRSTSVSTYRQIEEEGLLGKLQFEVYDCVFNNGPISQTETWKLIRPGGEGWSSIAPRFAELERYGVIEATGERPCKITGRNVLVWEATDRLPDKSRKKNRDKLTRKQLVVLLEEHREKIEKVQRFFEKIGKQKAARQVTRFLDETEEQYKRR